ncbi:hypothetical protein KFL_002780110 [Klebsormidium nitens]|uniref:DUF506 family protein n=1 Tax=Klebsormidium nitens TaxID=105231 RepID=A0A1Y1IBY5_KLENI|nr:hypothetical protein KFL_002780110 [Klebsormidium nitens]|eukprot:GAQ86247.1 hypothetical protein KFL_002780110 [Klebsormidium nitens]
MTAIQKKSSASALLRAKAVSAPLGASVKARLCADAKGHSAEDQKMAGGVEPHTVNLAAMVHAFIHDVEAEEVKLHRSRMCNPDDEACTSDCEGDGEGCGSGELAQVLKGLTHTMSVAERGLLADVTAAVKATKEQPMEHGESQDDEECSGGCIRRAVLKGLRRQGHNAAMCKSRWDHSRGFPGGDYEYIDVTGDAFSSKGMEGRVIVDVDFRAQFEIARPTHQYQAAIQAIPAIFVGRLDRLAQIVEIMAEACKQSLKKRGMHVPPWRRPEYLRAKWFSAYKRSTLSSSASLASLSGSFDSASGYASSSDKENDNGALGRLGWFAVAVPVSRAQRGVDVEIDGEEKVVFNRAKRGASARVHLEGGEKGSQQGSERHGVINLEWKPPAVHEGKRRMAKSVGSGLAGALMEAGLTGALRKQGAVGEDAFAAQQRQRQPKLQSLAGNAGIKQQQTRPPPRIAIAAL